ncbi:hypothetical protein BGX38DRAFT_1214630 [Terfezia claveryi]|nr:hypothetical protein BGX38DRAFT_1214630 [Terfezia claveryi]
MLSQRNFHLYKKFARWRGARDLHARITQERTTKSLSFLQGNRPVVREQIQRPESCASKSVVARLAN